MIEINQYKRNLGNLFRLFEMMVGTGSWSSSVNIPSLNPHVLYSLAYIYHAPNEPAWYSQILVTYYTDGTFELC